MDQVLQLDQEILLALYPLGVLVNQVSQLLPFLLVALCFQLHQGFQLVLQVLEHQLVLQLLDLQLVLCFQGYLEILLVHLDQVAL